MGSHGDYYPKPCGKRRCCPPCLFPLPHPWSFSGQPGGFMGRKKKPEPDDKEQSARFIKIAKEIQRDDAKEAFEEAISKIVKKKRTSKQRGGQ